MAVCDMCGKNVNLYKTRIEGTIMNVCRDCSRFGRVLGEVQIAVKDSAHEKVATLYVPEKEEILEEIVPDYAKKILDARKRRNMDQHDFAGFVTEKESVISKLEIGGLKPSLKLARKLQNRLGIKLVQVVKEEKFEAEHGSSKEFTIGDFITVKKKK